MNQPDSRQYPHGGAPPALSQTANVATMERPWKRSVMRKLALAAAAVAIATAVGVTAASAAPTATHPASGTEYFQVMSTATAPGPAFKYL